MRPWRDQKGNEVTFDQFVDLIAESILANLMAFDAAGVRRGEVQQIVGRDGGTLIGAGAMLQTPVQPSMTQEEGRKLFEAYSRLLGAYDKGEIPEAVLQGIRERGNIAKKIDMLKGRGSR